MFSAQCLYSASYLGYRSHVSQVCSVNTVPLSLSLFPSPFSLTDRSLMSDTIDEYKISLWMSVIVFTLKNIFWKLMWCGVVCKLIRSQLCGVVCKLICFHIPTHTHMQTNTHSVIVTYAHWGWNLWKRAISKFTPSFCSDNIQII